MFRRVLFPVWVGIILLSGMFLTGFVWQDSANTYGEQTPSCEDYVEQLNSQTCEDQAYANVDTLESCVDACGSDDSCRDECWPGWNSAIPACYPGVDNLLGGFCGPCYLFCFDDFKQVCIFDGGRTGSECLDELRACVEACIGSTPDLDGAWVMSGDMTNTWTCPGQSPFDLSCTVSATMSVLQENTESPAEFTFISTGTQFWESGPIHYDLSGTGTVDAGGNVTSTIPSGPSVGGCTNTLPVITSQGVSDGCTYHFETTSFMSCDNGCTGVATASSDANKPTGLQEGPSSDATCSDGWDNDCDGLIDDQDSDCQGYSSVANAEASSYEGNSLTASGSFNALALLVIPVGAIIALSIWRRKR